MVARLNVYQPAEITRQKFRKKKSYDNSPVKKKLCAHDDLFTFSSSENYKIATPEASI